MINVFIFFTCLWSRSRYGSHGGTGITLSLGQYGVLKSICDRKHNFVSSRWNRDQTTSAKRIPVSPLQPAVSLTNRGTGVQRGDTRPAQMGEKTAAFHRKTVSLRRTENSQMNQTEILMLIKENHCWVDSAVFYFTTASLDIFNIVSLQHFQ